jgi:hypothetical protein
VRVRTGSNWLRIGKGGWQYFETAWYIHRVLSIVCPVVTAHKICVTDIVQSGQPETCVCPGQANNLTPIKTDVV